MPISVISNGSETQFVESVKDYGPEWELVGESSRMPEDGEEWDEVAGKLKVNAQRTAERKRAALARDPAYLLSRIEELEARVEAIENLPK